MPRPRKCRNVCCLPKNNLYGPLNMPQTEKGVVVMSIEEYEAVRLIDLEGLVQAEAAQQMHIARTTVQRIYNTARKKLAEVLVDGKTLKIEGGDYRLCSGLDVCHGLAGCRRCCDGRPAGDSSGQAQGVTE